MGGSLSQQGAQSPFLECPAGACWATRCGLRTRSFRFPDMAHGLHPVPRTARPEARREAPGGLVIKHNANQRYATDAVGCASSGACAEGGLPAARPRQGRQRPRPTTGPSRPGSQWKTVDVGSPQLSCIPVERCGRRRRVQPCGAPLYLRVAKAVDVDGVDPFWADPGKGWGVAVSAC